MLKLVKSAAIIVFITLIIVSFQNCTQKANTGLLGSKSSGEVVEVESIDAPFAYDLIADTISYNSCVGQNLNESGLHGIKVGVNEGFIDNNGTGAVRGGLKLKTEFLQYVGRNVKPVYPATTISPAQIQYVLNKTNSNKNAHIQFAVRKRADLKAAIDLIAPGSDAVVLLPRDGMIEGANLTTDPVLSALTKDVQFTIAGNVLTEGPRIYNLYDTTAPRPLEASFGYSNYTDETYPADTSTFEKFGFGELYSERVRQRFNSGGVDKIILTQTYGDPTSGSADYGLNTPAKDPSADASRAYGRSFALRFEAPSTPAGWRQRQTLLRQVTETNLQDGSPSSGASWTCESFVITKTTHWNNTKIGEAACVPLIASDLQVAAVSDKVKKIRRHYSEEKWNVGLFFPANEAYAPATRTARSVCLAPKQQECYLPTTGVTQDQTTDIGVNYNTNTECYVYPHGLFGITYTGNLDLDGARRLGRCAHFASICTR